MSYFVYILYSDGCKKFYTGQSADIENRMIEHNNRETKSIRMCVPWRMVWIHQVGTRAEAMILEKKIKSRGAARYLSDLGIGVG